MRDGDHRAALVELHVGHGIVRHGAHHGDAGNVPGLGIFLARIAYGHLEAQADGDLAQIFRQLPGADHQHAVARPVDGEQGGAVEGQAVGGQGGPERGAAACHVERARHQLAALHGFQQFVKVAGGAERLGHQFDGAAAGQAEAVRFLGADAVLDGFGVRAGNAFAPYPVDEVVLDAAARDRAHHQAVVAHRQHRAFGPGRGAPGPDYRDQ